MRPRVLVFASGSPEGGGSGFEKLVEASRGEVLEADIVGVVSNHFDGGVKKRANRLGVPFIHFPAPWNAERYQSIAQVSAADFFALSGWLKLVVGLDLNTNFNSRTVFNIHPGPLPEFGGPGLHGHHVHEAVMRAFVNIRLQWSAVSMHFVTPEYDKGPVFFRRSVKIKRDDTAETLASRMNAVEHAWQAKITNLVVQGLISWDGQNPESLVVPDGYQVRQVELDGVGHPFE